jgi:protein tyrosine phosphatase (PTP) superfamily phosphohydrolase (DUF442 family)
MSRALILLLPALVLQAQDSAIPGAVEVRPGIFVHRGVPDEETYNAIRKQHVTHVIDLRRDGEPNLNCESEASRLQELGVQYMRYAITRTPPAGDFDFLRSFLRELPRGSKVVIHCNDGNRASAVACSWLVLDKGMPLEEAMRIAKNAGLQFPETEQALRRYISKGRV